MPSDPMLILYIPKERILVLEGDVPTLIRIIREIADQPDPLAKYEGVAVFATFTGGWYVFQPDDFRRRSIAFSETSRTAQTEDAIKDIFDIHEFTQVPVIAPGEETAKEAVVGDGRPTGLVGIWKAPRRVAREGNSLEYRDATTLSQRAACLRESDRTSSVRSFNKAFETDKLTLDQASAIAPFRRTPHLAPNVPTLPAVGERFFVEVYCDTAPPAPGETSEDINIPAPADQNEFPILAVLLVEKGLRVAGSSAQWLMLRRDEETSGRIKFDVVVEQAPAANNPTLKAIFYYRTLPCGSVTRLLGVEADPQMGVLKVPAGGQPADLTVSVNRQPGSNGCYLVTVTSPSFTHEQFVFAKPKLWDLGGPAQTFVAGQFAKFTTSEFKGATRLAALRSAGEELYDKAPQNFRDAYEQLSELGNLKTIRIISDEPHIPWELMVPPTTNQQRRNGIQRDPIGVAQAVGRWLSDKHLAAPTSLLIEQTLVLAPDYTGTGQKILAQSKAEADYLEKRFGAVLLTPCVYAQIIEQLGKCSPQLFHFVGHGNSEENTPDQGLYLEQAPVLRPEIVRGEITFQKAFATATPLVFLNACEVGQQTLALGGPAGFVPTFIKLDASGVIAPLWSVRDSRAHEIALELYNRAVPTDGPPVPVAEVLRQIRARAYKGDTLGEDTYAAYCFYGDPHFVINAIPLKVSVENPIPAGG